MLTMKRGLPEGLHEFINELKQTYTKDIVYAKCRPIFQHQYAISRLKTAGYQMTFLYRQIFYSPVAALVHNLLDSIRNVFRPILLTLKHI